VSVFVSIVGLTFLILIHEAGHFFVALATGMRPRRFYIFFPPALVKRVRNGIEYGIGAIPLGGYVKIPGMHRPAAGDVDIQTGPAREEAPWLERELEPVRAALAGERLDDAEAALARLRGAVGRADLSERARRSAERGITDIEDALSPDAYWRAAAWKRVAVIFAGPATNLLFAIALLAAVFMIGVPSGVSSTVENVVADSPAVDAGLQPGDSIVAVDGEAVRGDTISREIRASDGEPLTLTVERDGRRVELEPARPLRTEGVYRLGFELRPTYESFGPLRSVELAFTDIWRVTEATGSALARLITGDSRDEISSPVGIVQGSSQALDFSVTVYLRILALISLSLAILNLLPLLPLDGGHIAFSIIEKIRGRAIPRVAYERFSAVGIALVLLLFFIGVSNDVNRLNGG
jgi:regulator of sigma E protease